MVILITQSCIIATRTVKTKNSLQQSVRNLSRNLSLVNIVCYLKKSVNLWVKTYLHVLKELSCHRHAQCLLKCSVSYQIIWITHYISAIVPFSLAKRAQIKVTILISNLLICNCYKRLELYSSSIICMCIVQAVR